MWLLKRKCRIVSRTVTLYINLSLVDRFCLYSILLILTWFTGFVLFSNHPSICMCDHSDTCRSVNLRVKNLEWKVFSIRLSNRLIRSVHYGRVRIGSVELGGRIFTNKQMTKKHFVESESASSLKRFFCALLIVDFLVLRFLKIYNSTRKNTLYKIGEFERNSFSWDLAESYLLRFIDRQHDRMTWAWMRSGNCRFL